MSLSLIHILPEGHLKAIARDELPQSAAGKTIMTTEPKFIPKEAAEIALELSLIHISVPFPLYKIPRE